jgi:hypothetical protein
VLQAGNARRVTREIAITGFDKNAPSLYLSHLTIAMCHGRAAKKTRRAFSE